MFIGEYQHHLDQKGRMAIPAKFRKQLQDGIVVTRGIDACLFVFAKAEWDKLAEKMSSLPLTQANSRAFSRLLFAGAHDVELDVQGRILLPDHLRRYAGIGKKAIVAGVFNRLEIWDEAKWKEYQTKTERESEDIAERLMGAGI